MICADAYLLIPNGGVPYRHHVGRLLLVLDDHLDLLPTLDGF